MSNIFEKIFGSTIRDAAPKPAQVTCPRCGGRGWVWSEEHETYVECPRCDGEGVVPSED